MSQPLPNWGIIGNEPVQLRVARILERGLLRHAYLFTGPSQVGRRTLAVAMARAANCTDPVRPPYNFCRNCASCKLPPGIHPDITVISSGEGTRIGIDVAREVRRVASLTPSLGKHRFIIIDDAERLTPDASDALLKTLEEPAAKTTLVLIVPNVSSVTETIASRCQEIRLVPVAAAQIAEALLALGHDRETATRVAELSFGRPGWAVRAVQAPDLIEDRRQTLSRWQRLAAKEMAERLKAAAELTSIYNNEGRSALLEDLQLFIAWWKEQALSQASQGRQAELGTCEAALSGLQTLQRRLTFNVNLRLALEAAALDFP